MSKGYLVTFEGPNAVGKTTQANIFKDKLESIGLPVVLARDPGGVKVAEEIREFLVSLPPGVLKPREECELYYMSRGLLVDELIRPSLVAGKIVILDRFEDSSWVYQGILKGVSFDLLREYRKKYLREIRPDITFLLDAPYETVITRLQRQLETDYDRADELFPEEYTSIRSAYLWLAKREPQRWRKIDSTRSTEHVAREIYVHTEQLLVSIEPKKELRRGKER